MRSSVTPGLLGLALIGTIATPRAQEPAPEMPRHLWMVVAKEQPGMALYDAETDERHCTSANLGVAPHEGAFSPDGRMAYVPTYGSSSVGAPGTDEHTIHFIRTSDCQTVATVDTGDYKRPHHVQVGASGTLYVTAELKESILVIDPDTREITGTIPTGSDTTHMIALSADETTIFTSNVMGRTLSVLDVPSRRLVKTIPTEGSNQRMTISPDQQWFVTNLGQEQTTAFYRTADGELDFTVEIDGRPFVSQFSADGRSLYVMGSGGSGRGEAAGGNLRAWKVDVASRAVVATVSESLGSGAGSLAVSPVNGHVYLSAMAHDRVSIIAPSSWTVVTQIETEKNPDGLAFAAVE